MKKNLRKKLTAMLCAVAVLGTLFALPAAADEDLPGHYADAAAARADAGNTVLGGIAAIGGTETVAVEADGTVEAVGEAVCFVVLADAPTGHGARRAPVDPGHAVAVPVFDVTLAKAVERDIPKDPDDPREQTLLSQIKKYGPDVIVKFAAIALPFGDTYKCLVNYCKYHDAAHAYEFLLSVFTGGATFYFPWLKPFITVTKDLYQKIMRLF